MTKTNRGWRAHVRALFADKKPEVTPEQAMEHARAMEARFRARLEGPTFEREWLVEAPDDERTGAASALLEAYVAYHLRCDAFDRANPLDRRASFAHARKAHAEIVDPVVASVSALLTKKEMANIRSDAAHRAEALRRDP